MDGAHGGSDGPLKGAKGGAEVASRRCKERPVETAARRGL